jgi:peroxiredoxin
VGNQLRKFQEKVQVLNDEFHLIRKKKQKKKKFTNHRNSIWGLVALFLAADLPRQQSTFCGKCQLEISFVGEQQQKKKEVYFCEKVSLEEID